MRPFISCLLSFALLSTLTARAAPACAQNPDDEVDLVDGTSLRGKVTEQLSGSYVVIQTPDGRSQSVPWSQIKRVSTAIAPAVAPDGPGSAAAEAPVHAPRSVHFEGGVRLGYAVSSGDYAQGNPIGSVSSAANAGVNGSVPFTLDAGLRIGPYVYVGATVLYAPLNTSCPSASGVSVGCSGHDVRGGIDLIAHFLPRGRVDPWIGLGIGHEWLEVDISALSGSVSAQSSETFDGWNFVDLMLGLDFHMGASGAIGPYLELTSGNFTGLSASSSVTGLTPSSASGDIASQSSHQWFTLGLRGAYEVL